MYTYQISFFNINNLIEINSFITFIGIPFLSYPNGSLSSKVFTARIKNNLRWESKTIISVPSKCFPCNVSCKLEIGL